MNGSVFPSKLRMTPRARCADFQSACTRLVVWGQDTWLDDEALSFKIQFLLSFSPT